ncbi:RNA polymerase subunit sigma-70 [Flavobacterium piscis]|uniref:RNA polymerase subunit sigma-70 n=1 Tax=Flavobacterium piscis TaxID=1114874 RepID=A0ABX2XLK3_9FLAO|nr:sigma-70 family RNA polymerase sigma factor [Flavobacterium piscis]OCB75276.1 RNA polymerase subunit sigma-70 [Flavobacterium piscis]OXG05268.1 RNA polymerase subunit sigma-70 [Flavobacterium piscis]
MEKEFLGLIHENQKIIYKICKLYRDSREDEEDLFQEIVYQLWKSYPGFIRESKVSSWIYRIALYTAIATYRKSKISIDYYEEFPEHIHPSYEKTISENEERLFWALRKLNDSEKAVISLYLEDFNYKEIAEITGLSDSNVGVRLNRIKNKLKEILN